MSIPPSTSGVYQILCVPTGKVYIGSAINLARRWREHSLQLRKEQHPNDYFQKAWNKYGEAAFIFAILEFVPPEKLIEVEQYWIETTKCCDQNYGFNIAPLARSSLGVKRRQKTRKALSDARSHIWQGFIDPQGNEVSITNLWTFCHVNKLSYGAMHNLATGNGRIRSYKGWRHRNSPYKRWYAIQYKGFIDPNSDPIPAINNMQQFCDQYNLNQGHMSEVYYGKRPHHKGWTCVRERVDQDE